MEREIIHVDIASFSVAVERVVRPELRRRPVVVAPVGPARSVVTALSPEAWQAGIRKGMVLARALRCCRELVVLPPNEPLYARASRAVCRILQRFSPVLEPSGYGHAYVDITGTGRLFGPPRDAAWRAQKEIQQQLRLEAALGVASNKMVSKVASVVMKPAGLQDVRHGDEAVFLSPLPVRLLPGVGTQTEERLRELNIRIVRDLAAMRPDHLALAFGRLGFALHRSALGIDNAPVYPPRALPAVEEEAILAEDGNDFTLLRRLLFELCGRAAERLRAEKQRAARLELRIRYSDHVEGGGREKLAPPLQATAALCARVERLLHRVLTRRTRVRSMRIRLTDLIQGATQLELFADPKPRRQASLDAALDCLRRRFGPAVIAGLSRS